MEIIRNLSLDSFISDIKEKRIILFGAGIQGKRALMYFESWGCGENVVGILDNNSAIHGSMIQSGTITTQVYAPDQLYEIWNENTIIVIASLYYKEIYQQLEAIDSDNKIKAISLDEIADVELEFSDFEIVREYDRPVIPKIIHYSWFGGDKPDEIKNNIDSWKTICSDYEFIEWNESNYDINKSVYMRQAYDVKKWGFVPDYLRLDVLYKYGGIYLDTDIELLTKPDDLLYQDCFASVDATLTMNLGSGFGCVPGTEIIKELRDYYDNRLFVDTNGKIDKTSCNTHSYNVLKKYGYKINNRLQKIKDMNIYPMCFQGKNQHTGKIKKTEKTVWIHHGNMSWM